MPFQVFNSVRTSVLFRRLTCLSTILISICIGTRPIAAHNSFASVPWPCGKNERNSGFVRDPAAPREMSIEACDTKGVSGMTAFRDINIHARKHLAEVEQTDADFLHFLLIWQSCFTKEQVSAANAAPIIAACDRAAAFSSLRPKERERLARRRLQVLESLDHAADTRSDKGQ